VSIPRLGNSLLVFPKQEIWTPFKSKSTSMDACLDACPIRGLDLFVIGGSTEKGAAGI